MTASSTARDRRWVPKLKPHYPYLFAGGGFVLAVALFTCIFHVKEDTYKQLRGSLFTGFFTVAGFLLSAKTLVILNMKKEVYEKEHYLKKLHQDQWSRVDHHNKEEKAPRISCGPPPSVYGPLSQIGTLLTISIILALITSFSQITIGLTETGWAIIFCLSIAFGTAALLVCSVYLMWRNFHALYKVWENQAQEVLDEHWKVSMEAYHESKPVPSPGELPIQRSSVIGDNPPRK